MQLKVARGDKKLDYSQYIHNEGGFRASIALKATDSKYKIGISRVRADSGKVEEDGNQSSETRPPGIPLDPDILRRRENQEVDWVELEFENPQGIYLRNNRFPKIIE